jgi:nicotinamidase-related amidase
VSADAYTAPQFGSIALITIDTQRDVLDGQPLEIPGTSAALPNMLRLADGFRRSERPIVHIVRFYRSDGSNVDLCRRRAIERGAAILAPEAAGSQLAPGLQAEPAARLDAELLLAGGLQVVGEREVVMYKPRWGAFYETALESHLRTLGVSTLAFCGCNFPNCPRTSIYEASERDFRLVLVRDAVSGLYALGEQELAGIGVAVIGTDDVLDGLAVPMAAS